MGATRAEVHGPIRMVSSGENIWGGKLSVAASGAGTFATFVNLSSKVMRTTSRVLYSAINGTAAAYIAGLGPRAVIMGPHASLQGKLRIDFVATGAETAIYSFMVFDGGSNITT